MYEARVDHCASTEGIEGRSNPEDGEREREIQDRADFPVWIVLF